MTQIFIRHIHFVLAALALFLAFGLATSAHAESTISIAASGQVIVRGAKVASVSGSAVTARTNWGTSAITWTIYTSGSTKFYPSGSISTDTLRAIHTGDEIGFTGELDTNASGFVVRASVVKDASLASSVQGLPGTVSSVNAKDGTMVVSTDDGDVTVNISRGTFMTFNGDTIDINDIQPADKVQITGMFNKVSSEISADKVAVIGETVGQSGGFFSNIVSWLMGTRGSLSTR